MSPTRWPWRRPPRLTASGLRLERHATVVLADVDLEVRRGRCLAVVGHNGSGKSSLLRVLAGHVTADAGTVAIDGVVRTAAERREAPELAAATTDPATAPPGGTPGADAATVRERVTVAAARRGAGGADVDEALGLLGLVDHDGARADQLSSGLRQRAQLACALVGDAGLVLLDDPTAFLDARTAERVATRVGQLLRTGAAVVLSTHDHDLVRALADDVLVLADGRTVQRGAARAWAAGQ